MINLLPPEKKEAILYGRRNVALRKYALSTLGAGLVLLTGLVASILYGQYKIGVLTKRHDQLVEKLGPHKSLIETAKSVESKLATLKELFAKETNYVALLEDIEKTIVPGAQLQELELNGDEKSPLEMQFTISNELVAATLRNSLEASPRFKFVDIQDITNSATQSGTVITVTYQVSYEPGQAR